MVSADFLVLGRGRGAEIESAFGNYVSRIIALFEETGP
jgi:hypothetical protein